MTSPDDVTKRHLFCSNLCSDNVKTSLDSILVTLEYNHLEQMSQVNLPPQYSEIYIAKKVKTF